MQRIAILTVILTVVLTVVAANDTVARSSAFGSNAQRLDPSIDRALVALRDGREVGVALAALNARARELEQRNHNDEVMKLLARDIAELSWGRRTGNLSRAQTARQLLFARAKADVGLANVWRSVRYYFDSDLPRRLASHPERRDHLAATMARAEQKKWRAGAVMTQLGRDLMLAYGADSIEAGLVNRDKALAMERTARGWSAVVWRAFRGGKALPDRAVLRQRAISAAKRATARARDAATSHRQLDRPLSLGARRR